MSASLNLKGLSFLIADSDPFFLQILKGILRGFGANHIIQTMSGEAAYSMAQDALVDILICDAFLPTVDGFELCRKIRNTDDQTLRFVPVIVLTSHTQLPNIVKARDCGVSTVLAKPISPKLLFDRLIWLADDPRAFVKAPEYFGPDRRFKDSGPPSTGGRRGDDPKMEEKTGSDSDMTTKDADADSRRGGEKVMA